MTIVCLSEFVMTNFILLLIQNELNDLLFSSLAVNVGQDLLELFVKLQSDELSLAAYLSCSRGKSPPRSLLLTLPSYCFALFSSGLFSK